MTIKEKSILKIILGLSIFWPISIIFLKMDLTLRSKVTDSISLSHFFKGQLAYDALVFFLIQLCLYMVFGLIIWFIVMAISRYFKLAYQSTLAIALYTWGLYVFWVLYSNALIFERSEHDYLVESLLNSSYSDSIYLTLSTITSCLSLFALTFWLSKGLSYRKRLSHKIQTILSLGFSVFLLGYFSLKPLNATNSIINNKQPNIIIIGIDSLRPDYLSHITGKDKTLEIEKFIASSTVFPNTITPFARTFPSWVGILSGQYPKNSGARYNLIAQQHLQPNQLLAKVLKERGYETIFALDERRFANIDESYGFDKVIGPKMGAGDFVLSSINDIPLSNLFLNTTFSRWLFPFSHNNRAVHQTYQPESFDQSIKKEIEQHPENQPLLLVAHFCLPHWPYIWSEKDINKPLNLPISEDRTHDYKRAIEKTDSQFKSLMSSLETKGLLQNAIVILLSDHGESHGEVLSTQSQIDTSEPKNYNKISDLINRQEWGHGTNITRKIQHNVLLSIRGYGKLQNLTAPVAVNQSVSLLDITPTIFDLLQTNQASFVFDGVSLLPEITQPNKKTTERVFFLESGFSLPSILKANPQMSKVMSEGIQHYRIQPDTGLMKVKQETHKIIMETKQRGILWNDWLLFSTNSSAQLTLVNWKTGEWQSNPIAESVSQVPLDRLRVSLLDFYGNEIK